MNQKQYNELDDSLKSERKRYVRAVLKKAKAAGLNPKNLLHRLVIRTLVDVDCELVLALLYEEEK